MLQRFTIVFVARQLIALTSAFTKGFKHLLHDVAQTEILVSNKEWN